MKELQLNLKILFTCATSLILFIYVSNTALVFIIDYRINNDWTIKYVFVLNNLLEVWSVFLFADLFETCPEIFHPKGSCLAPFTGHN